MACRFVRFDPAARPLDEWVPPALRPATCLRRKSNPRRWNTELAKLGVSVSEDDCHCLHNTTSSWERCPLFREPRRTSRPAGHSNPRLLS